MYYILSSIGGLFLGLAFGALITYIILKNNFQKDMKQNLEELNSAKAELNTLHTQIKAQEEFRNIIKEDLKNHLNYQ